MRVFFDTEFTGLRQDTTLISIGCVAEDGRTFYAELTDYDRKQVNDWIRANVLAQLYLKPGIDINAAPNIWACGKREFVAPCLCNWLERLAGDQKIEIWADVLAYDWVLFCELFGGAFSVPECVYYIPFDLATLFLLRGIDPDIDRGEFANVGEGTKHNALWDARIAMACFKKLMNQ